MSTYTPRHKLSATARMNAIKRLIEENKFRWAEIYKEEKIKAGVRPSKSPQEKIEELRAQLTKLEMES
jgi:hypothetical protein